MDVFAFPEVLNVASLNYGEIGLNAYRTGLHYPVFEHSSSTVLPNLDGIRRRHRRQPQWRR